MLKLPIHFSVFLFPMFGRVENRTCCARLAFGRDPGAMVHTQTAVKVGHAVAVGQGELGQTSTAEPHGGSLTPISQGRGD